LAVQWNAIHLRLLPPMPELSVPPGADCSLSLTQPLDSSHLIEMAEKQTTETAVEGHAACPVKPNPFPPVAQASSVPALAAQFQPFGRIRCFYEIVE